jgi:hypothetical protein
MSMIEVAVRDLHFAIATKREIAIL